MTQEDFTANQGLTRSILDFAWASFKIKTRNSLYDYLDAYLNATHPPDLKQLIHCNKHVFLSVWYYTKAYCVLCYGECKYFYYEKTNQFKSRGLI